MWEVKIAHSGQWRGDYSASTETRMPSENELAAARYQGKHVASIAAKLAAKCVRGSEEITAFILGWQ